jgi:hypothetical protein
VLTADTRLNVIKIALSVVAGVGGVVALVVAYRKQRIGEAQAAASTSASLVSQPAGQHSTACTSAVAASSSTAPSSGEAR